MSWRSVSIALSVLMLCLACGAQRSPAQAPEPAEEPPAGEASPDEEQSRERVPERDAEGAPKAAPAPRAAPAAGASGDFAEEAPSSPARQDSYDDGSGQIAELSNALDRATRSFSASVELSSPDCAGARKYRDLICSLAERICELAAETPDSTSAPRCDDGRQRCARARQRYAARCE